MLTADDLKQIEKLLKDFPRRQDLGSFATKDDIKNIREDLKSFATKDDLEAGLAKTEKKIIAEVGEFVLDQIIPQLDQKVDNIEFERLKKQLRSLS